MTTTVTPPPPSATATARTRLRVTPARVVLSEWTKFRSLRSTVYTLLIAVVLMIGIGALFAAIAANQASGLDPGQSAVSTSLTGVFFAQLAIGVLGVLLISGEYSTGMIRSSLTVVPRRLPMLWGKLAVFAGVVFLTTLIASFTAFFVGQATAQRAAPGRVAIRPGCAAVGGRCGVVRHRRRHDGAGLGCIATEYRRRDHHLCRRVLRHPAADPPAARIVDGAISCSTCHPPSAEC